MTDPQERQEAKLEAAAALEHAQEVKDRSVSMGERWRKSKEDNNFRHMLRALGRPTG